jgi:hypothetical protein
LALKSLIASMEITTVGRAHPCRYNKRHRLEKGMQRLTVMSDGDPHNYCLACAKRFFEKDIERMETLKAEIEALMQT